MKIEYENKKIELKSKIPLGVKVISSNFAVHGNSSQYTPISLILRAIK